MLNLAMILRASSRRAAQQPALIAGDSTLSYEQLHAAAQRFAGALLALGIEPGEHVALMLPNLPAFVIAYFGAHYAAAPVVPLHVLLTPDEIAYHLEDSDAAALVVWEGFLTHARRGFERVPTCRRLIVVRASAESAPLASGEHDFEQLLAQAEPRVELPPSSPDDTAVILYTSGTTGRPKGAELTHFNMFYNAEYAGTKLLPPEAYQVVLATLPLFHSFGQTSVMNATLMQAGALVLLPRFEPQQALALMARHGVTVFAGVPTMYLALLHHPEASKYDLRALRYAIAGGSALPVEVIRAFRTRYGIDILEGYGLSETSPVASFNVLGRETRPGSIGTPLQHVEFKLVDEQQREITEPHTAGEICIKGVNVMKGYYKRPEATAQAIQHGWFATGDIAHRDADGYYYIVDRKKDMILRGGANVYPREVEEVLYRHPAVMEAAVVGVAHPTLGEEVRAIVALKPGEQADQAQLIAYCREHLAAYKYPRSIEFRDALPKGPSGKILKRELRAGS